MMSNKPVNMICTTCKMPVRNRMDLMVLVHLLHVLVHAGE